MRRSDTPPSRHALPAIDSEASVMDAIACMVSFDAPAVVVEEKGRGVAVLSEAELRRLSAARGGDPARTSIRQLLKPALAAARPRAAEKAPAPTAAAGAELGWTSTRWVEA